MLDLVEQRRRAGRGHAARRHRAARPRARTACHARNPRLVYGRMTGWGQDGPWSQAAGHDMNYIGITGALHGLGQDRDRPHFPGNLLGDFGGGSTYLVIGVLAALLEAQAQRSGARSSTPRSSTAPPTSTRWPRPSPRSASTTGTPPLGPARRRHALLRRLRDRRRQARERRRARAAVLRRARRAPRSSSCPTATTRPTSAAIREALTARFKERTQAEWVDGLRRHRRLRAPRSSRSAEAPAHPHLAARGTFVEHDGVTQPAPAPRFSRTASTITHAARRLPGDPHPRGARPPGASTTSTP